MGPRFHHLFNMCINEERGRKGEGSRAWRLCWDRNSRAPALRQRNMGPSQPRPQVGRGQRATFCRTHSTITYVHTGLWRPRTSVKESWAQPTLEKSICLSSQGFLDQTRPDQTNEEEDPACSSGPWYPSGLNQVKAILFLLLNNIEFFSTWSTWWWEGLEG